MWTLLYYKNNRKTDLKLEIVDHIIIWPTTRLDWKVNNTIQLVCIPTANFTDSDKQNR